MKDIIMNALSEIINKKEDHTDGILTVIMILIVVAGLCYAIGALN